MWYIHGHINFALMSGAKLCDFYDDGDAARTIRPRRTRSCRVTTPARSTPPTACGGSAGSSENSPTLQPDLRREPSPRSRQEARRDRGGPRRSSSSSTSTCTTSGGAATPCTTSPTCRGAENPSIPLGNIARYINMPDEDDPMIQFERAVKQREELTAKIRAKLADDPEKLAKFDECTTPPSTRTRSPRTTRSTSTRWASCCSARSCSPSAMRSPATA